MSCMVIKNIVWPTNKAALGVCYWLLSTNLGEGILCILSSKHNIHGGGGGMAFINNGKYVLWRQKVCWKCISQGSGDSNFKIPFPVGVHHGNTSQDTDLANSKETQSFRKNDCRQKCLDKSLRIIFFFTADLWLASGTLLSSAGKPLPITAFIQILKMVQIHYSMQRKW